MSMAHESHVAIVRRSSRLGDVGSIACYLLGLLMVRLSVLLFLVVLLLVLLDGGFSHELFEYEVIAFFFRGSLSLISSQCLSG